MNTKVCKRLILGTIVLLLGACKKEDKISTKELYVYAAPGIQAYDVIKGGKIALLGSAVLSETNAAFPVLISRAFEKEVEVTAAIDTGLVKQYDSVYKPAAPSPLLPAGAFSINNNGKALIKAGETSSSDSLQVTLTDPSMIKPGTNNYVVPVVLQMASNNVPVSERRRVMYMVIEVRSTAKGIVSLDNKNSIKIQLENKNGVNNGPDMLYLKGVLNENPGIQASVAVKENATLIDAYNQKNGTGFIPFPSGSYQLIKDAVTIAADKTESDENIAIQITDKSAFEPGKNYLLPIEIMDDNNPQSPPVQEDKRVVYITLSVFVNNVDPSNTGLKGAVVARNGWTVSASGYVDPAYAPQYAIDGSSSTAWLSGAAPQWFQVDIGSTRTIKGFKMSSYKVYGFYYGDIVQMEVFSSNDGTIWNLEGKYSGPTSVAKIVRFVTPVAARYFKFNITKTNGFDAGSYVSIDEINAYE